jgi:hypothetical protein
MRFRGNGMCMHSQAEDLEAFILRTESSGCALIYLNGPGPGAAVTATCTNQRLTNPRRRCQPMAEPHPSDGTMPPCRYAFGFAERNRPSSIVWNGPYRRTLVDSMRIIYRRGNLD